MVLRDEMQNAFTQKLPCAECKYNSICRYYNNIPPIDIPDIFEAVFTCREKERIDGGNGKEKVKVGI